MEPMMPEPVSVGTPDPSVTQKESTPAEAPQAEIESVKNWTERIRSAREKFRDDFDRMHDNMDFCAGFQWLGQTKMDDDRYIANLTLRQISQKVSSLYARNPKVVPQRVRRMDFQIWDGREESLIQASSLLATPGTDPNSMLQSQALLMDYRNGRTQRDLIDKIGQTLEHVFTYELGSQMPDFKVQMKQMVRRVSTTGVGYVRLNFARKDEPTLTTSTTESELQDRLARMQVIMQKVQSGEIQMDDAAIVDLKTLIASCQPEAPRADGQVMDEEPNERLVFDFPMSTSVIIDPLCRAIKGFVAAKWIAQEYIMTLDEINAFFKCDIKVGGFKEYNPSGPKETGNVLMNTDPTDQPKVPRACVWEVFSLVDKSTFFIVDGYKSYVQAPGPVMPALSHFWPIFPLTFNDIEVEPDQQKASIYPPSDVQLVKAAQKERNRTRDALRDQRKANAPKYMTGKGWLTEDDRESIRNAVPNSVIEIEGAQPNTDISKLMLPFQHASIDPMMYDTGPVDADMALSMGNDDNANPASTKATATAATINEQSRVTVTTSNVDDLDDLLTAVAEAAGQVILKEFSADTVKHIAGVGAVWPQVNPGDYVNHIYLSIMASSSGRPNKALEISNFTQLAPLLMQAGASPQFIVREAIKRLDDRLDIDEAFPMGPTGGVMAPQPPAQAGPSPSGQPMNGTKAPSRSGQSPSATVPNVQRPKLNT